MIRDEQLEKAANIDVAHPDENVMVRAAYIKEMAQELLERREAEQKNLMCWRKDYPEEGGVCEDSLAYIIADELSDNDETTEEIQLAVRLPNRKMRVWLTGGEDRIVNWEWV